jgi:hypothetical protein
VLSNFVSAKNNAVTLLDAMDTRLGQWVTTLGVMGTAGGTNFKTNVNTQMSQASAAFGAFMDNYATKLGTWVNNMRVFATTGGSGFKNNLNTQMTQAVSGTQVILNNILSSVGSFVGQMANRGADAGRALMNGLINGMNAIAGGVYDTARRIAENAAAIIRDALKINSPSKVTTYFGEMMGAGLIKGMESMIPKINQASMGLALAGTPSVGMGTPIAPSTTNTRSTVIYQTNQITVDVDGVQDILEFKNFLSDLEPERVNTFGHTF